MSLVHATVIERNYGNQAMKSRSRRQRLQKVDFAPAFGNFGVASTALAALAVRPRTLHLHLSLKSW